MTFFVIKRSNKKENVSFDKITSRIKKLCYGLTVDPILISKNVINEIYSGISTVILDELSAKIAFSFSTNHPDYSILASRITISNLHKQTTKNFSDVTEQLYNSSLISSELNEIVKNNKERLDSVIIYDRDYKYDFFGIMTLQRSYLFKINDKIIERPQHMLMRVSLGIHKNDIDTAIETYEMMSQHYAIHASPTIFNSGTNLPQLSSCFLTTIKEDSIDGIYDSLKECAKISKYSGGIGISISNVRATNSYIKGTNGISSGIIPMLRVFNDTARYVNQGGKRNGSIAVYLEPWHADIFEFLELRKNHGNELERARDLFLGLWIPDLFMERVKNDGDWSLFCPNEALGLNEVHSKEFEELYLKYEKEGLARKVVKAHDLWKNIMISQIETGNPYILFKDNCNNKSNQQNLGTIKSSNLCVEIIQFSSKDEVAVCNLASLSLPSFIENGVYNFNKLYNTTKILVRNLNKIIDVNFYPVKEAENSNKKHRPMGVGVQGLADVYAMMKFPYESEEAKQLNKYIFETIYFAALTTSNELAISEGTYSSYIDSPISKGILQFDMWNVKVNDSRHNWTELREKISKYGVRNSLLIAIMPTASTASILGNNESIETFTNNIYLRRTLAGEFLIINKHLIKDLISLDLWNLSMKNEIIANNGSVQNIKSIPRDIKELYKTVWEIKQKNVIDQSADRSPFICQSQSLNIHMNDATISKLTSMHFYAHSLGLKTSSYYIRTKAAASAIQFTVEKKSLIKEDDVCESCSA